MNSDFKIEIIKKIGEAQKLWNLFSLNQTLWENWDFRYCFYKYFNYELFFCVGYLKNEPIGLLPLQYNSDKNHLEFFGGNFMEENRVFIKPGMEKFIPDFYQKITDLNINYLLDDVSDITPHFNFEFQEYKYFYNIDNASDADSVFKKYLGNKKLKEKKRIIKKLSSKRELKVELNNYDDINLMFQLNIESFQSESYFNLPHTQQIFQDLIKLKDDIHLTTVSINNVKQAVSLTIKHNQYYVSLNSGINKKEFPDLRTYLIFNNVEQAVKAQSKVFDVCTGNCDWKEGWYFEKTPQYKLQNSL
ncbi:MAG: GNAT family N-acetyltransferase [Patescibacteria group bacterium]|nr:GNAT family N-acetyltransferase [Patescibacteria group bacterium]